MAANGNPPGAKFRFRMSPDGMKLGVSTYTPPDPGGERPDVDMIKRQVAAAGVTLPVDVAAAVKVLDIIAEGGDPSKVVLVRGVEVQEPEDGRLVAMGDLDYPVFPDEPFAKLFPAKKARAGQTIDGKITEPQSTREPEDIKAVAGDNVEMNVVENTFVALEFGMARINEGVLSVDPIMRITDDRFQVRGNLFHRDFSGRAISPDQLAKVVKDMGVTATIKNKDLDKQLERASRSGEPVLDALVAEGRYPVDGRDGWIEFLVQLPGGSGARDEQDRIDYRDRGAFPTVEEGQEVARLHPPTKGIGGIDVYGKTVPANKGKDLYIIPGEGAEMMADQVTFVAKQRGVLMVDSGVLTVTEVLVIPRDVGMNVGNVTTDLGSVKVRGSVLAGFSVEAPKHIMVEKSIESCNITAGGKVEVGEGILMPAGGKIRAGGDVLAAYMTNAVIEAGGSVSVINEASNCTIRAENAVRAVRGKGIIQGGRIQFGSVLEANELGSDLGVRTVVLAHVDLPDTEELVVQRKKLKAEMQKIDNALGGHDPKTLLNKVPPEKRAALLRIVRMRMKLEEDYKEVRAELHKLSDERREALTKLRIRAKTCIHPGVVIKMAGQVKVIKKRMDCTQVYWSPEKNEVVFASL